MNIIFCGMKHCGKSRLGKMLAKDLNYAHFDLDKLIERLFTSIHKEYKPVREIYKDFGAEYFMKLESKAFKEFLNEQRVKNADFSAESNKIKPSDNATKFSVISLGGGIADNQEVVDALKDFGLIIYLNVEEKILLERILKKGVPPFLRKDSVENDFHKLYLERSSIYEKIADLTIDLKNLPLEKNKNLIKKRIEEHIDAGKHIW